jgi:hypothetical protein
MNVYDSSFEGSQKLAFQDSHKSGEGNQVHIGSLQFLNKHSLGIVIEFGPELSRVDETVRDIAHFCLFQDAGRLHIAEHNPNFRRHSTRSASVGNRDEIRAFARTQDANAKLAAAIHAPCLQAMGPSFKVRSRRGWSF